MSDVRISVFVDDDTQRDLAIGILGREGRATDQYDGAVEGVATKDDIEALRAARLLVDVVSQSEIATQAIAGLRTKRTDPALRELVNGLAGRAPPTLFVRTKPLDEDAYRVWLRGPMRAEWRRALATEGIEICSFRSGAFQMLLTNDGAERVRALPFVAMIRRYDLLDSVSTPLLELLERAHAGDQIVLDVTVHRARDLGRVRELLESTPDAAIVAATDDSLRVRIAADSPAIGALADLREVLLVTPYAAPRLLADRVRALIGLELGAATAWTGKGEIVGVLDSGIDSTHLDFADRIVSQVSYRGCSAEDVYGHGTHVAGIIAGNGAAWSGDAVRTPRGVAPEAQLVIVGMTNDGVPATLDEPDLGVILAEATSRGASIVNLSWGSDAGGAYDRASHTIDRFVHANPEVLVVVASGNFGSAPNGHHKINTVASPGTAKNVITVGASGSDRAETFTQTWGDRFQARFPKAKTSDEKICDPDLPAATNGRGPTDYHAIKPDVLAPGTYVLAPRAAKAQQGIVESWSAHPNTNYMYLTGSSMAAPVVAGAAAVVRQYLREIENADRPSAALLKALLLASVRRMHTYLDDPSVGYPDFHQGFGRIELDAILPMTRGDRRAVAFVDVPNDSKEALMSGMPPGGIRRSRRIYAAKVPVGDACSPLRVVLVWTDFPGNSLQNRLQLRVRDPQGEPLVGNPELVYGRDEKSADLGYGNSVRWDGNNNVLQIHIEKPREGEYQIAVHAISTLDAPQGYALVASGASEGPLVEVT